MRSGNCGPAVFAVSPSPVGLWAVSQYNSITTAGFSQDLELDPELSGRASHAHQAVSSR
jgi:hypothetical protein